MLGVIIMENNDFQEITKDKVILGQPMKKERDAYTLIGQLSKYSFWLLILAVAVNGLLALNLYESAVIAIALNTIIPTLFWSWNIFTLAVIAIYFGNKKLLHKGLKEVTIWKVRISSLTTAIVSLLALAVTSSILVVASLWGGVLLQILITQPTNDRTLNLFGYTMDYYHGWAQNITTMGVTNTALIIVGSIALLLVTFYGLRIFVYSLITFFNSFKLVSEKYTISETIEVKTLEDTPWNRDIVEKIAIFYHSKSNTKTPKELTKEMFTQGEVRALQKFNEILGVYSFKKNGDFSRILLKNEVKNIETTDLLFQDYTIITLKTQDTSTLYIAHDDERRAASVKKLGYKAIKANDDVLLFQVKKPSTIAASEPSENDAKETNSETDEVVKTPENL